jgi:hypothetical protein
VAKEQAELEPTKKRAAHDEAAREAPKRGPVAEALVEAAAPLACSVEAVDVRVGLGYTAVKLADGNVGTAMTFHEVDFLGCGVFTGLRPLAGRAAWDLVQLLGSPHPAESAVGLAAVNACLNRKTEAQKKGDVLAHLALDKSDRVGMVGCFGPLIAPVRKRAGSLEIFERIARPCEGLRPAAEVTDALTRCTVALVTGTAVVNNTIDAVLEAASACRAVVVLGASTPLCRKAFGHTPVNMLSGVVVRDGGALLRIVSEGGGMRQFKKHVDKVNLVF